MDINEKRKMIRILENQNKFQRERRVQMQLNLLKARRRHLKAAIKATKDEKLINNYLAYEEAYAGFLGLVTGS